ncbi:MAG: PAS domain S-box protein [Prolixibacteraceae bacterium]
MNKKKTYPTKPDPLRQQAEVFLDHESAKTNMWPHEGDALKLIHELQVHQIELEMQREELTLAKEVAEAAGKKAEALFDFAPSGYFTIAPTGEILDINFAGAKILGLDRKNLKNKRLGLFVTEDARPTFNQFLNKLFDSKTKQRCEIEISSGGITTYILLTGLVIENSPNCWLTAENITERKQSEEALQRSELRFKKMFDGHSAIMLLIDHESGRIIDANAAATEFYGYNRLKLVSMSIEEINILTPDLLLIEREKALSEEKNRFIFTHRLANGDIRIVDVHSSPIDFENHQILYSIVNDITDKRKAEKSLIESEDNFRAIFQNSIVGTTQTFFDGTIKANSAYYDLVGYSEEELPNVRWQTITHPDDVARDESIVNSIFAGEKSFARWEKRYIHKNGTVVWVDISTALYRDITGLPKYLISSVIDISKQKLADEIIKKNDKILRLFIQHSPAAIAMFDLDMKYLVTSHRFLIDYEVDETNIIGRSHYEVFPEIPQYWKDIHKACLAGSTERCEEDLFLRRSGKLDWIKWEICPWFETDNQIGGIILFSEVITDRKLAEDRLKTSTQLTKDIIDNSPSLFYLVDSEGKFLLVNHKLETILGIQGEKLIGNTWNSFLPKDIADQQRANDFIVIESKQSLTFEEENIEADGKHIYLTQKFPLFDTAGKVYAVGGISTDITENKKAADNQRINEAKWHNLFEILPLGVSILDSNNHVIDFNPALSQILDISEEGLLKGDYAKRNYFRTDLTKMSAEEFPSIRSVKENKIIRDVMIGVQKEDKTVIWTNVSAAPLPAINGAVTVTIDITERKMAEEELLRSEEKWKSLVSNSPDFIALLDREGRYLFLNHYSEGFSEKDVLGKKSFDNISTESGEIFRAAFEKCILEMTNQEIEYGAMGDHKETRMYESSLVPFLAKGNEINILVVARDITERKKSEQDVRKSKEQLTQLYKHLSEVREEERTNIAREIHDDLGQSLAGLKLDLIGMIDDIKDNALSKQKVDKAISLVDSTIKTVQKLTSELRPQMLDELGLASAIEWQSHEFRKRTGIKCRLKLVDIDDLTDKVAISLFRIFQASLTNIMLHAKAKSVSVKLGIKGGKLQLIVKDDGRGITPEQLNSSKSFGIIGMRERVNQINGKIEFRTKENSGTEIKVTVPLVREDESGNQN